MVFHKVQYPALCYFSFITTTCHRQSKIDSCISYIDKSIKTIEDKLNSDFNTLCDWFVDNKLSIHFGEDKTKSILFSPKNLRKRAEPIVIKRHDVMLKQFPTVEYLGCLLDAAP